MRVIAIVNQKGGCGKTTTTINLAGCLAADGHQVLVIDLDPQAHSTLGLGIDPENVDENLYDVLAEPGGDQRLNDILVDVEENLDLAPAGIVLSALEQRLASEPIETRAERLRAALAPLDGTYDYVLLDCPPSVGLLTFNALRAASEVIVPLETSQFAIHGVEKLLETIGLLVERIGHDLTVRVLPTLYDGRTRYARETLGKIRERFKDMCFDTVIRSNVKLREAAARGVPIVRYARSANGAIDHSALAVELEALGLLAGDELPSLDEAPREVVVRFRDQQASDVRIAGDFNGWVPDKGVRSLIESEGGTRVWTKILQLPPGRYEYRYVVDGEWREDPDSSETLPTGLARSVLVVR
ncbi:MAG: AAA family ATPase [Deltaproteobacteria bacterium]|nr:AAA family ATPase [Deltaproteobacteria bacterium]